LKVNPVGLKMNPDGLDYDFLEGNTVSVIWNVGVLHYFENINPPYFP
jgi:hypothetical protein